MVVVLLEEFFDYKNLLMKDLCSNEDVVKLITNNEEAAVPNNKLPYTQIFPYQNIPETVDEAKTFICYDVDIIAVDNKTFYTPVIYIWICTHKSKYRCESGGVLLDKLSIAIDKMLNGSRFYGLGELKLDSVTRFIPVADFMGREMIYYAKDFNRPWSTVGSSPSNRKKGV